MNIIDLQESLKDYPDNRLMAEYQRPTNNIPQFLILGELQRRKRMRDEYKRQEATNESTVAEEMITGVGVPQEGLTTLASALTPNTALSQDTGTDQVMSMQATRAPQPQMAADGGILNLFKGGRTKEDLYRRVEPFPENGTAAERRNWTLTYGMTHDADGMPKRMLPDVATTDVSPTVDYRSPFFNPDAAEVSTDLDDFMPKVSDDTIIPRTQTSPISPSSVVGDLPFLPPPTEPAETESERLLREDVGDFNRTRNVLAATDEPTTEEQMLAASGALDANYADPIDPKAELEKYLQEEREEYNKKLEERGPEDTAGKDSLKRLLVRPPVAEFLNSFRGESTVPSGISGDDPYDEVSPTTIAEAAEQKAAEDAETSAAEALQDQEDKIAPKADEDRRNDPLAFIDSVTDGGADGAGFGSYDSEIAKYLSDRRKRADQNKWLALAEAGFAMMGPAATFGEGIGKGGKAGLKALRDSQKGLDAFETDMLKLQASLDIAQQKSADTRYGADTRAATARYSADQAVKSSEASTKARSEATQQRLGAQTNKGLNDLIAIYDSQLDDLGIIPGQAPPAEIADRYNQIIRERQAIVDELKRRVGANVAATGGSELFGQFNVT